MTMLRALIRDRSAAAGAEMAFVAPMLIILMFGSMELGNYFLNQHAITKQVRDGARYASRLPVAAAYNCSASPATVFEDSAAEANIIKVTKTGAVVGDGAKRFPDAFWVACASGNPITVTIRCVDKDAYGGIYRNLVDDIPVVKVSADVAYNSLFASMGFNTTGMCMRAESELAVAGL